jgi:hypothetical protein
MRKLWRDLVLYSTGFAAFLVITLTSMVLMFVMLIIIVAVKIFTFTR